MIVRVQALKKRFVAPMVKLIETIVFWYVKETGGNLT